MKRVLFLVCLLAVSTSFAQSENSCSKSFTCEVVHSVYAGCRYDILVQNIFKRGEWNRVGCFQQKESAEKAAKDISLNGNCQFIINE